jgi:hypothetical protein
MNKESLPQSNQNEEVDLGHLFNALGNLFNRFIKFLHSIVKFVLSIIINLSRAFIDNFKLIATLMILAGILGFVAQKFAPKKYESTMLVRTYFDAKYQLQTNLNYYNTLLDNEDYTTLSRIFNLEEDRIKSLSIFELDYGPETENMKISDYDEFLKSLDSVRAQEISYDEYLDNRDLMSSNIFEIRIESDEKEIFKYLEHGINKSFENLYSLKKRDKRDSLTYIKRQTLLNSIVEIDSLQNVYINVLEEESQSTNAKISLGEGFPLQQEKSETKEFQLLNKEIELRNALSKLDEAAIEENDFFDVISTFQEVGNRVSSFKTKYSIIFPLAVILLLFLIYLTKNYVRFVQKYEG